MPGYLIFDREITDPVAWQAYREVAGPVMAAAGGKFLMASSEIESLEGDWFPSSLSIVEFPSFEAARDFYYSDAYQETVPLRQNASRGRGVLVQSTPPK